MKDDLKNHIERAMESQMDIEIKTSIPLRRKDWVKSIKRKLKKIFK